MTAPLDESKTDKRPVWDFKGMSEGDFRTIWEFET